MIPVEKNEVDIAPLFSWHKEFEIKDEEGNVLDKVYVRILGDSDMNKTRVQALRRSAELRKKLRDSNSDERVAFILNIEEMETEQLLNLIAVLSMRDISQEAMKKVKPKLPKAPKGSSSLEKQEKYQEDIDSYPKFREKEIKKAIEKEVYKLRDALSRESKEFLYSKYVSLITNELCEQELNLAFKELCSYYGTFKDNDLKERYFSSFEEFSNLPSSIKGQFMAAYQSLELFGDELKKSLHLTQ
jgi:hypothetical protein